MDDNQIINKGGDDRDISEYSKQNGADLPDEVITPSLNTFLEEKKKEFEVTFTHANCACSIPCVKHSNSNYWSFISTSISEAWEMSRKDTVDRYFLDAEERLKVKNEK